VSRPPPAGELLPEPGRRGAGPSAATPLCRRRALEVVATVFLLVPEGARPPRRSRPASDALRAGYDSFVQPRRAADGLPKQPPSTILLAGSVVEPPATLRPARPGRRLATCRREGTRGKVTVLTRCGGTFGARPALRCRTPPIPGLCRTRLRV
jgi:hypothetical protein